MDGVPLISDMFKSAFSTKLALNARRVHSLSGQKNWELQQKMKNLTSQSYFSEEKYGAKLRIQALTGFKKYKT